MSLLNGFSQMGAAVSQFAGNAGLSAQKIEAEKQAQQLADQLMTQREHVGRVESGRIAEQSQGRAQDFQAGQNAAERVFQEGQEDRRLKAQRDVVGMQLEAGRYQAIPVQRLDESGNPVQGYLNYNTRTGKADFVEGTVPVPKYNQITPNQALIQARRDYKSWADKDKNGGGDGTVHNLDGSVADEATWVMSQAEKYRTGQLGNQSGSGAPKPTPKITNPSEASQAVNSARDAIKRGAPKDAVIKRLRDAGITPPADL